MNEREGEEFYVGYLTHIPPGIGKLMRMIVIALFGIIFLVVLMIVLGLQKLPLSSFEFGQEREFIGVIKVLPYPSLLVREGDSLTRFLLVATGKHGADVDEFDGKKVKLAGTRIFRDGMTMLEIVNGSIHAEVNTDGENLVVNDLGKFTLVGEIVDSKCYLGVMNPGNTKPHRECAALCISGGVPPVFIAHDEAGNKILLLLESVEGKAINEEVLDFVAEPIEISGQVWREGEQLTLRAELKNYRRIQ